MRTRRSVSVVLGPPPLDLRPVLLFAVLPGVLLATSIRPVAALSFTETPQFGAGNTICVAWADLDGDGDDDLVVGNVANQPNPVYWSQGDGTFVLGPNLGNGATFAVTAADFDNDGDRDVAIGNGNNQQNWLFVNDGTGAFTQRNEFGTSRTVAMAWGDADSDGDLDLAVGNGILGSSQQNWLYRNDGDGTFTQEAQFGLRQTCTLAWGDCDGDGDLDLAIGNGGFGFVDQNYLYRNDGTGTFTEEAQFGMGDTSSLAWGDVDNDGDLDLAVANWNAGQSYLYVNDGTGSFTELPRFGTRDPNTISWGDADDDGDLDLAMGNGDFTSADQNYLYVNNGDLTFTEEAHFGLGSTDGVAWSDADGDGDLDLAVGNEHTPTTNYLYRNDAAAGDWLEVKLVGRFASQGDGYSNADGIGAKVFVYAAGSLGDPGALLGFREVSATGGFTCQLPLAVHFGVPGAETVDVRIVWPGSGGSRLTQDLSAVATGQRLVVIEGLESSGIEDGDGGAPGGGAHGGGQGDPQDGPNGGPYGWGRQAGARSWLGDPAPNPSRGEFGVEFALRAPGRAAFTIVDPVGRVLATWSEEVGAAGRHRVSHRGVVGQLESGTYWLRMEALGETRARKVTVLR